MKNLKKSLAVFLAVLCIFSAFSVAGFAENVNIIEMTARNSDSVKFTLKGHNDYELVCVPAGTAYTGVSSTVWSSWATTSATGSSNTEGNVSSWITLTEATLKTFFPTGEIYDEYVIYARRSLGGGSYEYASSVPFRFAPKAPEEDLTKKTENSITVKKDDTCVYKWEYYNTDTNKFKNGSSGSWKDTPTLNDGWQTSNVLSNIEPNSTVAVFMRYSSVSGTDIKESAASYTVTKTYKKAPDRPGTPVLVNYTKDTISVSLVSAFPVEFAIYQEGSSLSKDAAWVGKQTYIDGNYTCTHTFTKLTKSTQYFIVARGVVEKDQLPGESSLQPLGVLTAERNKHNADINNCVVTLPTDTIKAGNSLTLTATGDMISGEALEGDTRYVPISWVAAANGSTATDGHWDTLAASQTATVTTGSLKDAKYTGKVTVTVTFQKQEYSGGAWHNLSTDTNSGYFNVEYYGVAQYGLAGLNVALQLVIKAFSAFINFLVGLVTAK